MQDHVQDKISFVEIVAAVIFKSMSGADDNSLSHASSAAKNYGTVTTRVEPGYIEHVVEKTDTLQGIALKYGTTVEIVRRVNKLHSAGMLHLKDLILIPCQNSLLSSGSYRGSPNKFQRISPNPEQHPVEVGEVRSIDEIFKSADHQLKISHTFAQKLAERYPQKSAEGYNKLESVTRPDESSKLSRGHHHKALLSSKEDKQKDQKEKLENDLFEL